MNAEKKQDFPRRKIVFLKVHNENFFNIRRKGLAKCELYDKIENDCYLDIQIRKVKL